MDRSYSFKYDNSDFLFAMKQGKKISERDAFISSYGSDYFSYKLEDGNLDLDSYDAWEFDGKTQRILTTPIERLRYIYASIHDDEKVDNMVKEVFPEIYGDIIKNPVRYTNKYYLQHWMEKYGFDLKDFWLNNKYIVICSSSYHHFMDDLADLGIINWDNIEYCSEYEEEVKDD